MKSNTTTNANISPEVLYTCTCFGIGAEGVCVVLAFIAAVLVLGSKIKHFISSPFSKWEEYFSMLVIIPSLSQDNLDN
jgi:hypothetical protein